MTIPLDDQQVMRHAARIQAGAVAIIYEAFTDTGMPEALCHQLTVESWRMLFNDPTDALVEAIDRLNKALGADEGGA